MKEKHWHTYVKSRLNELSFITKENLTNCKTNKKMLQEIPLQWKSLTDIHCKPVTTTALLMLKVKSTTVKTRLQSFHWESYKYTSLQLEAKNLQRIITLIEMNKQLVN